MIEFRLAFATDARIPGSFVISVTLVVGTMDGLTSGWLGVKLGSSVGIVNTLEDEDGVIDGKTIGLRT